MNWKRTWLIVGLAGFVGVQSGFSWTAMWSEVIHNGTGQDAYDFHLEGNIQEGFGQIVGTSVNSAVPGFDWTSSGFNSRVDGTISAGWAGNTAVPHCSTIQIGLEFWIKKNLLLDLYGCWTDVNGNQINPDAGEPGGGGWLSDVPLLGFQVDDNTGMLFEQNATSVTMDVRNLQIAPTSIVLDLSDLTAGSPVLGGLTWRDLTTPGTPVTIASGDSASFDIAADLATAGYANYVVVRGEVLDPNDPTGGGEGTWHGVYDVHQIPEPSMLALCAVGGAAILLLRLHRKQA